MGLIFDLDQTLVDSSMAEVARSHRQWQRVYSLIPSFFVYDRIIEVIQCINSKQIPFAIVTSAPETYCNKVLLHFNIQCNVKVCYHDTKFKKPYPDPILLAAKKIACNPLDVYSFGDRDIDIIASNSAGSKSVACLWGAHDSESLLSSRPTLTMNHTTELLDFVRKI